MDNGELPNTCEQLLLNDNDMDQTEGLEDMSLSDDNENDLVEEQTQDGGNYETDGCVFDQKYAINSLEDLWKISFKDICAEDLVRFHFLDVGVAYMFYNWYANVKGFAARKSKIVRSKEGEIIQQTFLCYKQGYREEKVSNTFGKKREPKPYTRCGCEAKCRVHIERSSGRWYIKYLNDEHNHTLVDVTFIGMLPAHRKMSEYDIAQMNIMRSVGINTPHIYGLFAKHAGGYDKVGFRKKDMYNEVDRQRRSEFTDANAALGFLNGMRLTDDMMYCRHTVNQEGRLEHLFWCDGVGRRDYAVFGDVLAFDATYRKNKYMLPLVVFSGVNHHNQSIVFASAIVSNELEDTYVWLLEQLMESMGGKVPSSVITDGDMAMKNAIKRVFPEAHHRLCAWHLLRNATTNVGNKNFVSRFRQCMLGDFEIGEFKQKWEHMVTEFGLEENNWVRDLYEKRSMWATAHIRGNFFAGFRTTSRCEGLHSQFGRYVNYQNNLLEFLQHFFRGLNYMRYKEVEADFSSLHGEPVLQTPLRALELSAAKVYTREVFLLFRTVLERACTFRVTGCKETTSCHIFTVTKYRREGMEWHVSYCSSSLEFKCSCARLESLGIPCEHLIIVMVNLDIVRLPDCVILSRWTMNAKDSLPAANDRPSSSRGPTLMNQYFAIVERCKRMATAAIECGKPQYMRKTVELVDAHTMMLESIRTGGDDSTTAEVDPLIEGTLRNPARVRTKGCGVASTSTRSKTKRVPRKAPTCGICRGEGHNKKSCHLGRLSGPMTGTQIDSNAIDEEDEYVNEDYDVGTVDMHVD